MTRKYFGTDGIRGQVGQEPITPESVLKLGWAAGTVLARGQSRPQVLIGKDTRLSGYLLESALEAGLSAAGVDVSLIGPIPTPAVAYLTRSVRAEAGIVISASHNPFQDNGIKFFGADGRKLADALEAEIEAMMDQPVITQPPREIGRARRFEDARGRYIEFCKSTIGNDLTFDGLKVVIDCANGAAYDVAPRLFRELGADVITVGTEPDGLNINDKVGSTHVDTLRQKVLSESADFGIAFDGDADRVMMVDEYGRAVDGDQLLYIAARWRHQHGQLHGGIVGTQMTNLALEQAFERIDVPLVRAKVGDRHVLQELDKRGWQVGGENSGHLLFLDKTTTGDGMVSALEVLNAVRRSDKPFSAQLAGLELFPQEMINVALPDGVPRNSARAMVDLDSIQNAVAEVEAELGNRGRVLLRPSGTEPVIRVMVEGQDGDETRRLCEQLAQRVATIAGDTAKG
ncbi:phosphoglucosamine mutase [Gammaproteobacteria bacterium]|nr:phosphoglucosamine mutase [Gammaproteobacteria bacterium]